MPRPTNKQELKAAANEQFAKLLRLIDAMPDEHQTANFVFEDRDKNVRDVLMHLHEWHNMVQRWHKTGVIEGGLPEVPGKGYTWRTLPGLNKEIWEECQGVSLQEAKILLKNSHKTIIEIVDGHINTELFARGVYKWTKSTTLGAYFVGCTSSHYEWAMKKLKKHKMA